MFLMPDGIELNEGDPDGRNSWCFPVYHGSAVFTASQGASRQFAMSIRV